MTDAPDPHHILSACVIDDLELHADDVIDVVVMAAAAMACMAALGHGEDIQRLVSSRLMAVSHHVQRLQPGAMGMLSTIAEEIVECAEQGKTFLALGNVRLS